MPFHRRLVGQSLHYLLCKCRKIIRRNRESSRLALTLPSKQTVQYLFFFISFNAHRFIFLFY